MKHFLDDKIFIVYDKQKAMIEAAVKGFACKDVFCIHMLQYMESNRWRSVYRAYSGIDFITIFTPDVWKQWKWWITPGDFTAYEDAPKHR